MLRTIFEAECSLSPTEGILGKEQPLEVLKTSALNHIPTGWTLWMFVWVHVYVCVSFYKPECVWTDVISLLTTSCVTLHACLFLLGCHKLSCRLWSAITSEMSLHFVRLKVDGVWRDDAVLLCFIYAGVSACRLFFLFLGFFCWMTIQQCVCELTWNYTKTNYSTQFHLPQTNHTTSCEPRHPEYAQIGKCLLAAYKRGEFIAARGQRRDGAAQREARVQKWKGHRWRDEVIWRRNESEVIYA